MNQTEFSRSFYDTNLVPFFNVFNYNAKYNGMGGDFHLHLVWFLFVCS